MVVFSIHEVIIAPRIVKSVLENLEPYPRVSLAVRVDEWMDTVIALT